MIESRAVVSPTTNTVTVMAFGVVAPGVALATNDGQTCLVRFDNLNKYRHIEVKVLGITSVDR